MAIRYVVLFVLVLWSPFSYGEEAAISPSEDKSRQPAEEAITIPLSEIWALNIEGTKDIRELEGPPDKFDSMTSEEEREKSLVSNTAWRLSSEFRPSHADSGFVVTGSGIGALKAANAIMSKKEPRIEQFAVGEELTLVFFAYSSPRRIRFEKIVRTDHSVTVKYRLLDRGDGLFQMISRIYFALIPIGCFQEGTVRVRFEPLPGEGSTKRDKVDDFRYASRTVCDWFTFRVVEKGESRRQE